MRNRGWQAVVLALVCTIAWSVAAGADGAQKWALVVGVDKYDSDQITPLKCAGNDARALAKVLVEVGFPANHVVVMTSAAQGDDRPTAVNVLQRLAGFGSAVKPGDEFVFYFSGHGMEQDGESFLLTSDSKTASTALLQFSSLSLKRVQQALGEIRATRVLKLVDACRNDPRAGRGAGDNPLGEQLSRDLVVAGRQGGDVEAVVTLFSCSKGQRSYEGYNGHGYFTYFLVEGLRGAAAGTGGAVRVSDLAGWLERNVADTVRLREAGKEQVPWASTSGSGAMSWVLTPPNRVALVTPPPAQPPQQPPIPAPQVTPPPRAAAPPVVKVTAPGAASRTARDYVVLVGSVTAEGGVADVSVSVNGADVALGGAALKRTAGGAQVNVRVPLETGENTVVLMATGKSGLPGQAAVTVERTPPPAAAAPPAAAPAPTPKPRPAQPASRPVAQPAPVAYNPPPPRSNEMVNPTDGSVLLRVSGGAFTMGSNDYDDERPPHRVTVGSFWMGKVEVTNAQYRRFVNATGHASAGNWQEYAGKWGEDCPVVNVSWNDATAYCRWAGGRLPREAEWEYAARGSEGRKFPWGDDWDAGRCVNATNSGKRAQPVGRYPGGASPFGCLDMAGNVWEWVDDWYDAYPGNSTRSDLYGQKCRVCRGGSWYSGYDGYFRGAFRDSGLPDNSYDNLGFRLARTE